MMDLRVFCVLLTLGLSSFVVCEPKHWAVLVAGSNGYFNYRHQADICHAYQILRKNGIPDESIIVMMYDLGEKTPQLLAVDILAKS